jgi:hypothetical protein
MAASHTKCPRAIHDCGTSLGSGNRAEGPKAFRAESSNLWLLLASCSTAQPAHSRGRRGNRAPRWAQKPFSRNICRPDRDGTLGNYAGFRRVPNNTPNAGSLEQPLQPRSSPLCLSRRFSSRLPCSCHALRPCSSLRWRRGPVERGHAGWGSNELALPDHASRRTRSTAPIPSSAAV